MPTLNWLQRDAAFRAAEAVPYRLLQPISTHGDGDARNWLVHGDNLQALKALLPLFRGQVKCIFIDPPYNTKSAFEHYDDNLEHSQWLSMMLPRLQLLREFLREDGSIWVTIDDHEGHYLKVLMDEVFGRGRFVANCVWQKRYSRENRESIGDVHDHLLVYAVNASLFKETRSLLPLAEKQLELYRNPDSDPRGKWQSVSLLAQGFRPNQMYEITAPSGRTHLPPPGNCWKLVRSEFDRLLADHRVYFGADGNGVPRRKEFLVNAKGLVPWTWWPHEEVGHTDESKKEANALFGADISFGTPKPERLLQRILHIATNPGDLVLDSFLGSGTTAAVAHKMGRRWIGIEMGEHARTHCLPRLQKVVQGEQGGISPAVGWQGGGGFRLVQLGEPVFTADGRIDPAVRFAALAAFVWQQATRTAYTPPELGGQSGARAGTPQLGTHEGTAVLLLYNGILGDRRPEGGNVLNLAVLQALKRSCPHDGPRLVYGEACTLGPARLAAEGIEFRQIPYELAAR